MRSLSINLSEVILAFFLALFAYEAHLSAQTYSLTDLGTLGGSSSAAFAINNNGQIVGQAETSGDAVQHAFLYSGGSMHDLGSLNDASHANGINDSGQISGYYGAAEYPFIYSGGAMQDLTKPAVAGYATGINNSGQVIGSFAFNTSNAFLYSAGVFYGSPECIAFGINNIGQVVGASSLTGHAFIYNGGSMKDLGTLGGNASVANAINNLGQVVGWARLRGDPADATNHAFLYSGGLMQDLGSLKYDSSAKAINDNGQVVGYYLLDLETEVAFLYEHGVMYDLNTLIPTNSGMTLQSALGINNIGQIVGFGKKTTNPSMQHAFLLSPVANVVPPTLTLVLNSKNTALLKWIAPSSGYVVRQTSTFHPANWVLNSNNVTTINGTNEVSVLLTNTSMFFQLIKY